MISLPDVNVLVALAWPNHLHHRAAHRWFRRHHTEGWATCPPTQSGFVRVSSNVKVIPQARTPAEAIEVLRRMVALENHFFWHDDFAIATSTLVARDRIFGYRQVSDAHLLALALHHKGRVATFDRGLIELLPHERKQAVLVIPTE